jgi:hypothetical protein
MSVWYDPQEGLMGYVPGYGEACLATPDESEVDREIAYVSIQPRRLTTYTWMPSHVREILVEVRQEPGLVIWHDDCSDASTFPYLADTSWFATAAGSISSENGYIYATDYGTGSGSHGPLYYQPLPIPFEIGNLDRFVAEIEVDAVGSSSIGAAAVYLFDENYHAAALLDVADSWSGYSEVSAYSSWYFPNGSKVTTPNTSPLDNPSYTVSEPYHETMTMSKNETGLFADIPRVGQFKLIDSNLIDLNRVIKYVGVNLRTKDSATPPQIMRIHDILLEHNAAAEAVMPVVLGPGDFGYEFGTTGHTLTWSAPDEHPISYTLYRDEERIASGPWSTSDMTFSVDGLDLGTYEFMIEYQAEAENGTDSATVTVVDTTVPTIDSPEDITYVEGDVGNEIIWTPSDLKPDEYEIFRNLTRTAFGVWFGDPIIVNVDGLTPGIHAFTLAVYDSSGNTVSDTVLVFVERSWISVTMEYLPLLGGGAILVVIVVIGGRACRNRSPGGNYSDLYYGT